MTSAVDAATRIAAILLRYLLLHRRSLIRLFDIMFWPVMDLLVWGFVTLYLQQVATGSLVQFIVFFIGAMISWDIHYRGQQAVTISLMEEVWTRNITNIFISPVRLWEWIAATCGYGLLKVGVVTIILSVLAYVLYAFNILQLGWSFIPLAANLLLFGWAIGLFTAGLLLRFGYAAEALIWGIPFLIQPFSCVFYPVNVLPLWAQVIARVLPSTYVFEGLRQVLQGQAIPWTAWAVIIGLNGCYAVLGSLFLVRMFRRARSLGRLGRLGQD